MLATAIDGNAADDCYYWPVALYVPDADDADAICRNRCAAAIRMPTFYDLNAAAATNDDSGALTLAERVSVADDEFATDDGSRDDDGHAANMLIHLSPATFANGPGATNSDA